MCTDLHRQTECHRFQELTPQSAFRRLSLEGCCRQYAKCEIIIIIMTHNWDIAQHMIVDLLPILTDRV